MSDAIASLVLRGAAYGRGADVTSGRVGRPARMRTRSRSLALYPVARAVLWFPVTVATACEGDTHQSTGVYALTLAGGLTGRVSGATTAEYHANPGVDHSFTIDLPFPAESTVFPTDNPGALDFVLDSLPTPGTYAAVPIEIDQPAGQRRTRRLAVLLMSSSGAESWDVRRGTIVVATVPGAQNGIRARFTLDVVRTQPKVLGAEPPTASVVGTFETR